MDLVHHQIDEGINLYLYQTEKFKTITGKVFIQNDLTSDTVAANALIPMILRRGSEKYPTTLELAKNMEYLYGAALGADVLKIGERQILEFYFDMVDPQLLPAGHQVLKEGLDTLGELVGNPVIQNDIFNQAYFDQEKLNLKRMVDGLINDKRAYAIQRAIKTMCKDEPFGLYKYGDQDQIAELDNIQVYQQYRDMLATSPIDIFFVGPNLAEIPELVNSWNWQRHQVRQPQETERPSVAKPQEIVETRDVQQAVLVMGYRTGKSYLDSGYYSLLVANGILGAFPHSKLFINVREKASLAYYVGSSLEGSKGLITVTAGIAQAAYQQAVDIINAQVNALQSGEISDAELEQTKIGLISGIRSMVDTPTSIIDRNVIGLVHQELRSPIEVMDRIAAVTKEQAQAAAQGIKLDTIYFLAGSRGEQ